MAVKKKSGDDAGYKKFRADLAAGNLGNVYLFYGEETYLREFYLAEVKKQLVPPGFEAFNFHRLEGKGLTVQALTEAAEAMPMMAERTMVQVTDYDPYKLPEEQRNALIALLSDFPSHCCLVLVFDQAEYKPNRTYKKLHAALEKSAQAVQFAQQDQREILKWIAKRFKAAGHTIDAAAAEHLVFTCGGLMNGLIPEIEKVSAYAKNERVTKADIDAVAAPVLATVACGVLMFRSRRRDAAFAAVPVLMGIVYLFAVKMHERYLFPAFLFMLLAFLFTKDRRLIRAYGFFTAANYLNVSYVLWLFRELGGSYDPNATPFRLISLLQLAALFYMLWAYWQGDVRGDIREAGPRSAAAPQAVERAAVPGEAPQPSRKKGKKGGKAAPAPEVPQRLGLDREARRMARLDWLVMGGVTLIYAFVAFWHLGGTVLPTTNWTPNEGESVVLHCGETANSLIFLPGLSPDANHYAARVGSSMKVETSMDGETWADCGTTSNGYVFAWKTHWLDTPGNYVRLTALDGSVTLSEAGLLPAGAQSAPGITAEGPGAERLCDEQDTVPAAKTYENSSYFDEIYHARTAYEHILGLEPYENPPPPLGKHIIALGIRLFGMNPFGWRFMGTLFGVLMLPVLYHLCKQLLGKAWLCGLGTLLFAFDFMHFTQTRIATIDTYSVFFLLLMYDAMVWFLHKDIVRDSMKSLLVPLGLSGLFMGLGVASKWTAAYGAVGLAVLFFGKLISAYLYEAKGKRSTAPVLRRCWQLCAWCCLLFVAIPFGVYFCAFLPMTTLPHNIERVWGSFWNYQTTMFNYHSQLVAEHDFSSVWYEWPLVTRPIWFYGGETADGLYSTISSMGNPLLWWACIPAALYAAWKWLKKRELACGVALAGFLSVYLPWVLVPRLTFIYHYFTAVPFLVICLLAAFQGMGERGKLSGVVPVGLLAQRKVTWAQVMLGGLAAVSLVLFGVYFPVISGLPVSREYVNSLELLGTWYFG